MTSVPLLLLWNDNEAKNLDEQGLLFYRSNLFLRNARAASFGCANTSAKLMMREPITEQDVKILMVKSVCGDNAPAASDDFATVYLHKLELLKSQYRSLDQEDKLARDLRHCVFDLNACTPPIEAFLHGFLPQSHVDLTYFNAVNSIAMAVDCEQLVKTVFGDAVAYLPWQKPGIDLGIKIGSLASSRPGLVGIVLGGHGLLTWGETSKSCYETTSRLVSKAADWLNANVRSEAFGGQKLMSFGEEQRKAIALRMMPEMRGLLSSPNMKVGHFNDSPEVLEFANSKGLAGLVPLIVYCSDPLWNVKIGPLVISSEATREEIAAQIAEYRSSNEAFYNRFKTANSPAMRDPSPTTILVPQVGMFTFAASKIAARRLSELCACSIDIMRGVSAISNFQGLTQQDLFNLDYGSLGHPKHSQVKTGPLSGRIALVTGGANGIGAVIAERFLSAGACVAIADIDSAALKDAQQNFATKYGPDNILSLHMDVTSEAAVIEGFTAVATEFGGLDIVVNNAGIAIRSPVEDTTIEMWDKQVAILGTGYFLVGREGFRLLKRQNIGGSMIFISSKNGLIASEGASAYGAMKAAELHLARSMALEGAPLGIRVNSVTPDAVLRGSKLMAGNFAQKRAEALNIRPDELEEYYRKRSLLQRSVYSEDVAEAVYFFASDLSLKSTGNILNVDAGHVASFTR